MSDLIEWKSPDTKNGLRTELASPLIPPPAGSGSEEPTSVTNGLPNLMSGEKRPSLDNNPFDQVFKETAEYVRKREDPFEMVLENVSSSKKTKRHSVDFQDDFIPKHTRYAEVLKMNKTLDESVLDIDLNSSRFCLEENSIIGDLNNTDLLNENSKDGAVPEIAVHAASPINTSILNYSAMNDSLTGKVSSANAEETAIRSLVAKRVSMCIQKGIMDAELMLNPNQKCKLINGRRCLSQTDGLSPKRFDFRKRSHSIIDRKRSLSRSEQNTLPSLSSMYFEDPMNQGFCDEQYIGGNLYNSEFKFLNSKDYSSVFSDLSNVSAITSLGSNSCNNSIFNGAMNQGFFCNCTFPNCQHFPAITLSPANSRGSIRSSSASTNGSLNASESARSDLSDLRERFNALKVKLSDSSPNDSSNTKGDITELSEKFRELKCISESGNSEEKSKVESEGEKEKQEDKKDEKLIDVEVFVPSGGSASSGTETFSGSSSDSVFTISGGDKSIMSEARKLARTFEEMAENKIDSDGLDLLSNHTEFDFDQLPDSDDEVIVDNLIDLPPSPFKPEAPPNSPAEVENGSPPADESSEEKNKIRMKEIEMEFIQPKDPEKKIKATSLLLELEKLIKTEQNPDAEKLLIELEKVLGVKWENNTELLGTYLQNAKSNLQIDKIGIDEGEEKKDLENKDVENKDSSNSDREDKENESIDVKECKKEMFNRGNSFVIKKGGHDVRKMQYPGLNRSISSKSLDSSLKVKSVHDDSAVNQVAIRNNSQLIKEKIKLQIPGVKKRFSSDPNFVDSISENKQADSTRIMKKSFSSKVRDKLIPAPEIQKSTISYMTDALRNKFKHKSDTGVSKRGPMKATISFGNMHRRGSIGKKTSSVAEPETPPKKSPEGPPVYSALSSTPNSFTRPTFYKKSKSKPVASSTPDSKEPCTPFMKPPSPRKRNFSWNISPVPTHSKANQEKLGSKDSPKGSKINASPRRPSTPKARRPPSTPSGIPKYSPRPQMQRRRSLNDLNKSEMRPESPQAAAKSSSFQKTPISTKKVEYQPSKSPLRNLNKIEFKAKPFNLISKMRRRGSEYTEAEKENYS
ncbi:uncharacterized protein LOC117176741 isoform X3 [Belonocnema kinseyi]|uniref:uncharacterized protein LOC117176741 isoform X3 n=1 Tax=Belonocnema kinseyi TaxID=2817044 RepID=UPI00143D781C|nr:uncharacterized protein LOC117176741 isoform X3 [Belonocnema kinseyi]